MPSSRWTRRPHRAVRERATPERSAALARRKAKQSDTPTYAESVENAENAEKTERTCTRTPREDCARRKRGDARDGTKQRKHAHQQRAANAPDTTRDHEHSERQRTALRQEHGECRAP